MAADTSLSLPRYLRREEAAKYVRENWGIPCAPKWLAKLAVEGGGPVFRKAGRFPMYAPSELDKWAEGRLGASQTSTAAYLPAQSHLRDR